MIDETQFRIALIQCGLSQNRLAYKIGLHPSVLSAAIRGYRRMEPGLQHKLAQALGVSIGTLFNRGPIPRGLAAGLFMISRLWILIAIFFLVVAFAVSFVHFQREQNTLRDDLNRRARVIAKSLAPPAIRILKNPPAVDEEDVAERLEGQGRTLGLMICNLEGKLIARSSTLSDIVTCSDEVMTTLQSGNEALFLDETRGQSLHSSIG